jgi:glycosyltransferase involved in cell wall biosynthesis
MARFLRSQDLVFFEWAGSLLVRASQLRRSSPMVVRLHSFEITETASQIDWSKVALAIMASEPMSRRLLDAARVPPKEMRVVKYGIDVDGFRPRARSFQHRIGMACSVVAIKRVYEAVLCVYELRRQGHPFTLDVTGRLVDRREGRYPLAVLSLVDQLGLKDSVVFRNHVDDVADWYGTVDVFLSNSFWEGTQVALLEAMASGCYCLSHCWPGAEEVLPPQNLFVTDSDLRAKLLAYASLPEGEKALAQAEMRDIAERRFDERRMVQETVELVEQVVRGQLP